jgi:hypothetical protein
MKKGKKKKRDDDGTSAIPGPGPILPQYDVAVTVLGNLDVTEIKSRSGVLYDVLANGLRQCNSTSKVPIRRIRVDPLRHPRQASECSEKTYDGVPVGWRFDEFEDFGYYDSELIEFGAR